MEIELKILEIDVPKTIETLKNLSAIQILDADISAKFYINIEKKKVRLRKIGNKNILTYKIFYPDKNAIKNKEIELEFSDFKKMENLLEEFGFKKYGESKKHRLSFSLDGIHFDIDTLPGIPTFIEIESDSYEKVKKGVEILGYTIEDTVNLTERTLKEHYQKIKDSSKN